MLRGSQKRMIVVRTRDSRLFEEAYFVMRRETAPTATDTPDMLWEANRIIENTLPPAERSEAGATVGRPGVLRALWFGLGALCGGGAVGLLWLLL
jgi:hypothetical protein